MRRIAFNKYHALGNDFIIVDLSKSKLTSALIPVLSRQICDRHTGVGADGVVYFSLSKGRFAMRIFNADGGEAELSGNGLRILGQYLVSSGITRKRRFEIYSAVGANEVIIRSRKNQRFESSAFLPAPRFETRLVPMRSTDDYFINQPFSCEAGELIGTAVNVGNPHMVFFVDNFDFDWRSFGQTAERAKVFIEKTNVEFAQIKSRGAVVHRIWERGAGETSASGSGASAVVAAGVMNGFLDHQVIVHEPAGVLKIELSALEEPIMITGPTMQVGEGTFFFEPNA